MAMQRRLFIRMPNELARGRRSEATRTLMYMDSRLLPPQSIRLPVPIQIRMGRVALSCAVETEPHHVHGCSADVVPKCTIVA